MWQIQLFFLSPNIANICFFTQKNIEGFATLSFWSPSDEILPKQKKC